LNIPKLEEDLGIEVYASRSPGIGGKIRSLPEDFRVEEILIDGSKATVQPDVARVSGWGRYLLCILTKRNWDTLIALRKVAEYLGINLDRLQIAGIKDAKASTAQHITISGIPPEKILEIRIRDITVKPLRFVDQELSPHLLFGNNFHIAIRGLEQDKTTVEQRIEKIRGELETIGGLPNYFGHQRFGSKRPITHLVGYHIIRRNFEDAALAFLLKTSQFENPDSREARRRLNETQDFKAALNYFPERLIYEKLMLKHLAKYPRDFLGALNRLPLRLRKLFVQSYQSFLFNRFLSGRIKQGVPLNEPRVGDYVTDLDASGLPTESYDRVTDDNLSMLKRKVEEGKAGIAVPLIGFRQPLSQGAEGTSEETVLDKEGISPSDFHIPEMPSVSSSGGLRLISMPVIDLYSEEACEDPLNPNKLMIALSFTLHRGSYATTLLREFMKPQSDFDVISSGF